MFEKTSTQISPWVVINSNNKMIARLTALRFLLNKTNYENKKLLKPVSWSKDIANYSASLDGVMFNNLNYEIINVPMRDYFGNNLKGNFIADTASDSLVFTTLVNASYSTSRIRRVEYLYQNNALIRKQYYADNPYSYDEFFETTLLEDISEIEFSYLGTSK